jgi:hypothetical protein
LTDEQPASILNGFRRYGQVTDPHSLHEDVQLLWQLPLRYLRDAIAPARLSAQESDTPFDSTIAYISNGGFNAAIRHEERAVAACIFAGVPLIAFRACRLLASRIDLRTGLPVCDEAQRLVVYPEPLSLELEWHNLKDFAQQARDDLFTFEETAPTENNELATFLFDISMRYVAMHEAMHFVLGHARYCQRTLGLDAFTDVSDERRELDPVVSQTLEFIADRHTISGIMTDLAEGRLFHEWCINAPSEIEPEPEVWRRRVAISALALMSKLWKTTSSQGFADFSLAYPHPYERMAWMICGLHEMSKEQARSDIDRCFALNLATLERNFTSPVSFTPLIQSDLLTLNEGGISQLNRSYAVVRAKAIDLQKSIYKNYGPFYPGV